MFNLHNKKALVTGASGSIGSSIARVLHRQGASVIISGTNEQSLITLAEELGERVKYVVCNLGDNHATEQLIETAANLLVGLDILVCNAGITRDNLVIRMSNDEFLEVINTNLTANFILNKATIKKMIKQKYGRIINISSIVGIKGNAGQANYCASKAGLIAMSKSLAAEVAMRGITVNCVAPGFIETPMTEKLKTEQKQKYLQLIPNNCFGKPQDVATTVAFLASDEASYINGQTIHVNGGMLMI